MCLDYCAHNMCLCKSVEFWFVLEVVIWLIVEFPFPSYPISRPGGLQPREAGRELM